MNHSSAQIIGYINSIVITTGIADNDIIAYTTSCTNDFTYAQRCIIGDDDY
jgi:hypothetical protein